MNLLVMVGVINDIKPLPPTKMAAEDGVERLVFTHLSVPGSTADATASLLRQAHETFKGEVFVTRELDRFQCGDSEAPNRQKP